MRHRSRAILVYGLVNALAVLLAVVLAKLPKTSNVAISVYSSRARCVIGEGGRYPHFVSLIIDPVGVHEVRISNFNRLTLFVKAIEGVPSQGGVTRLDIEPQVQDAKISFRSVEKGIYLTELKTFVGSEVTYIADERLTIIAGNSRESPELKLDVGISAAVECIGCLVSDKNKKNISEYLFESAQVTFDEGGRSLIVNGQDGQLEIEATMADGRYQLLPRVYLTKLEFPAPLHQLPSPIDSMKIKIGSNDAEWIRFEDGHDVYIDRDVPNEYRDANLWIDRDGFLFAGNTKTRSFLVNGQEYVPRILSFLIKDETVVTVGAVLAWLAMNGLALVNTFRRWNKGGD